MLAYIIRRLIYAIPILIGVNLLTFALFFVVNTPEQMARVQLGDKHVTEEAVHEWKAQRGYDKPLLINGDAEGAGTFTETIFFEKSLSLFALDFGKSDAGRNIAADIEQRMWPSLAVALPTFIIGISVNIAFALFVVMFRASIFDTSAMILCVGLMSVSGVFYVIAGQFFFAKEWSLVPISGYLGGADAWRFLLLPVIIGVVSGIGGGTRLYRTLFLEEANKDYVRTARAKGLAESKVFYKHALKNSLGPLVTVAGLQFSSVMSGAVVVEYVFNWPGLGTLALQSIQARDTPTIMGILFFSSFVVIFVNIITDLVLRAIDPRIRAN